MAQPLKSKELISPYKMLEATILCVHILNPMKNAESISRCHVVFICMVIQVVESRRLTVYDIYCHSISLYCASTLLAAVCLVVNTSLSDGMKETT